MPSPHWAYDFPPHIELTQYQVERLELIRSALGASEVEFRLHVVSHPECTIMLQRQQYELMRDSEPGQPDEYYFVVLILRRFEAARFSGGDLFDLRKRFRDSIPIEDQALVNAVIDLIRERHWSTIDQVAEAMVAYEEAALPQVHGHPSTADARHQITLILREGRRGS